MSHTALSSGVVVADDREEIELPSGAKAQILKHWYGKHIRLASRIAGHNAIPGDYAFGCAVIAVRAKVNGTPIAVEDLEGMWADDVQTLWGYCMGKGGRPSPLGTSPSSESTEDSPPPNSTE